MRLLGPMVLEKSGQMLALLALPALKAAAIVAWLALDGACAARAAG